MEAKRKNFSDEIEIVYQERSAGKWGEYCCCPPMAVDLKTGAVIFDLSGSGWDYDWVEIKDDRLIVHMKHHPDALCASYEILLKGRDLRVNGEAVTAEDLERRLDQARNASVLALLGKLGGVPQVRPILRPIGVHALGQDNLRMFHALLGRVIMRDPVALVGQLFTSTIAVEATSLRPFARETGFMLKWYIANPVASIPFPTLPPASKLVAR